MSEWVSERVFVSFGVLFFKFCDVAGIAIIHKKI